MSDDRFLNITDTGFATASNKNEIHCFVQSSIQLWWLKTFTVLLKPQSKRVEEEEVYTSILHVQTLLHSSVWDNY
jgi:hypothetical protein